VLCCIIEWIVRVHQHFLCTSSVKTWRLNLEYDTIRHIIETYNLFEDLVIEYIFYNRKSLSEQYLSTHRLYTFNSKHYFYYTIHINCLHFKHIKREQRHISCHLKAFCQDCNQFPLFVVTQSTVKCRSFDSIAICKN